MFYYVLFHRSTNTTWNHVLDSYVTGDTSVEWVFRTVYGDIIGSASVLFLLGRERKCRDIITKIF